jgi:hypothetical protein
MTATAAASSQTLVELPKADLRFNAAALKKKKKKAT